MPRFQSIDKEDSIHARSRASPMLKGMSATEGGAGQGREGGEEYSKLERQSRKI